MLEFKNKQYHYSNEQEVDYIENLLTPIANLNLNKKSGVFKTTFKVLASVSILTAFLPFTIFGCISYFVYKCFKNKGSKYQIIDFLKSIGFEKVEFMGTIKEIFINDKHCVESVFLIEEKKMQYLYRIEYWTTTQDEFLKEIKQIQYDVQKVL